MRLKINESLGATGESSLQAFLKLELDSLARGTGGRGGRRRDGGREEGVGVTGGTGRHSEGDEGGDAARSCPLKLPQESPRLPRPPVSVPRTSQL